jgi:hypothetical protein
MDMQSRLASDTAGTLLIGGNHFARARGQSSPPIGASNCAWLSCTRVGAIFGQQHFVSSSVFANKHAPLTSHQTASIRSALFEWSTYGASPNGSTPSSSQSEQRVLQHFFTEAQIGDYLAQLGALILDPPRPPHLGRQQAVISAVEIDNSNGPG